MSCCVATGLPEYISRRPTDREGRGKYLNRAAADQDLRCVCIPAFPPPASEASAKGAHTHTHTPPPPPPGMGGGPSRVGYTYPPPSTLALEAFPRAKEEVFPLGIGDVPRVELGPTKNASMDSLL